MHCTTASIILPVSSFTTYQLEGHCGSTTKMKTMLRPPSLHHHALFSRAPTPNPPSLTPFHDSRKHFLECKRNPLSSSPLSSYFLSILCRNRHESLKHPPSTSTSTSEAIQPQITKMGEFRLSSSNFVIMAALTVGAAVFLMDQKAMALGPEGPLVEEFWENMRRYALYALTVSSGVAYAVLQPILELLRNPISAILVIAILVGTIYTVSQVLSAMVGVSDFTYDYSY